MCATARTESEAWLVCAPAPQRCTGCTAQGPQGSVKYAPCDRCSIVLNELTVHGHRRHIGPGTAHKGTWHDLHSHFRFRSLLVKIAILLNLGVLTQNPITKPKNDTVHDPYKVCPLLLALLTTLRAVNGNSNRSYVLKTVSATLWATALSESSAKQYRQQ